MKEQHQSRIVRRTEGEAFDGREKARDRALASRTERGPADDTDHIASGRALGLTDALRQWSGHVVGRISGDQGQISFGLQGDHLSCLERVLRVDLHALDQHFPGRQLKELISPEALLVWTEEAAEKDAQERGDLIKDAVEDVQYGPEPLAPARHRQA